MPKILNFGSLNLDYVYSVEHLARMGESVSSTDMQIFCGGKGLNQSVALAKAGAEVYHAGFIGRSGGDLLLDTLRSSGVRTDLIKKRNCPNGHAIIQVDASGQNSILLYGGANQTNTENYIDFVLGRFGADDLLVLQNEINLNDCIIQKAKQKGLTIALNPSPADEKIAELPLKMIDCLILNEVEAESLCGASDAFAIYELRAKFPRAAVLLTLGNKGAVYMDNKLSHPITQGIIEAPVVDTTGAGDTFTGFFLAQMAAGATVQDALRLATAAAALAVSRKGAAASIPTLAEAEKLAER
jgi:ribokinase